MAQISKIILTQNLLPVVVEVDQGLDLGHHPRLRPYGIGPQSPQHPYRSRRTRTYSIQRPIGPNGLFSSLWNFRIEQRGGCPEFPGNDFYLSTTVEYWSTPLLFVERENCGRPYRLLSNAPCTGRTTAFHKNEFSGKPCEQDMVDSFSGTK